MNDCLLYEGKSKSIYAGREADEVIIRYRDTATAGNGEKREELEGKGRLNAAISALLYEYLGENGVETHMLETLDDTMIRAKKVEVIMVEVIVRNVAAGGFSKKYGVAEGSPLHNPVLEFCNKSDALGDPMMNKSQITAIGLATTAELNAMQERALRVNGLLIQLFTKAGIELVDFKLEFGRYKGRVILCDEISPDSCRLWDAETHEKLDKDRFRRDLGDVLGGYREVLRRLTDARQL